MLIEGFCGGDRAAFAAGPDGGSANGGATAQQHVVVENASVPGSGADILSPKGACRFPLRCGCPDPVVENYRFAWSEMKRARLF